MQSNARFVLREPAVGELGWIVHRQAILCAEEYGWDCTYEGLIAGILADFVARHDAVREQAWVAEHDGKVAGCIFLMRGDDPLIAQLRLLYVEPEARGLGLGTTLVAACVARARAIGYDRMTLRTENVLISARRLYQAAGFRLVSEVRRWSFGHDLIGQTWQLDFVADPDRSSPV